MLSARTEGSRGKDLRRPPLLPLTLAWFVRRLRPSLAILQRDRNRVVEMRQDVVRELDHATRTLYPEHHLDPLRQ